MPLRSKRPCRAFRSISRKRPRRGQSFHRPKRADLCQPGTTQGVSGVGCPAQAQPPMDLYVQFSPWLGRMLTKIRCIAPASFTHTRMVHPGLLEGPVTAGVVPSLPGLSRVGVGVVPVAQRLAQRSVVASARDAGTAEVARGVV